MAFRMWLVKMKADANNMDRKIQTREFCIDDYDATLQLWQRVEGLEVAEGDEKEGVAQFVARNPGLSRVAIDGLESCWCRNVRSRRTPRTHLSRGG